MIYSEARLYRQAYLLSLFTILYNMSVVLLVSSLIYEITGFVYADVIGAAGLIYFSVSEGRESFEKQTQGLKAFD
jgi:hypothetical protein